MSCTVIHHISFSESGGAGNVATQLNLELQKIGVASSMFSLTESNITRDLTAMPGIALLAAFDKYALTASSFGNMTTMARGMVGKTRFRKILDSNSDILHIHWPWSILNLKAIDKYLEAGVKVVWTLHDMRPLTGFCHFTGGCFGYETQCANCPASRSFARPLVIHSKKLSDHVLAHKNLTLTSPSPGVARAASSVPALRNKQVREIPNPVISEFFKPTTGKSRDEKRFGFVAANLSDPRKGLSLALEFFESVRRPGDTLTLVGDHLSTGRLPEGVTHLGPLESSALRDFLHAIGFLLFFSIDDNAPLVLAEAAVCGSSIVVGSSSSGWEYLQGQADLIKEESFDLDRSNRNTAPLTGVSPSLDSFRPENVAKLYVDLYRELVPNSVPTLT